MRFAVDLTRACRKEAAEAQVALHGSDPRSHAWPASPTARRRLSRSPRLPALYEHFPAVRKVAAQAYRDALKAQGHRATAARRPIPDIRPRRGRLLLLPHLRHGLRRREDPASFRGRAGAVSFATRRRLPFEGRRTHSALRRV